MATVKNEELLLPSRKDVHPHPAASGDYSPDIQSRHSKTKVEKYDLLLPVYYYINNEMGEI